MHTQDVIIDTHIHTHFHLPHLRAVIAPLLLTLPVGVQTPPGISTVFNLVAIKINNNVTVYRSRGAGRISVRRFVIG